MEKLKNRFLKFKYKGILGIVAIYALISIILITERSGIQFNYQKQVLDFLPASQIVTKAQACSQAEKTALIVTNFSTAEYIKATKNSYEQFSIILSDMKIGYDTVDLSSSSLPNLSEYEIVVVMLDNLSLLKEDIITLCDWVYDGGNVLFPITMQKEAYSSVIDSKLGIVESSYENAVVNSIYIEEGFMIGGGRGFEIPDGYESAREIRLDADKVKIYAYTDDETKLPLIWEAPYGKGKFVVDNFGLCEKATRGLFSASLSLLTDISVYPVINGSVFYLDDFPSQIPSGNSDYIQRDYQTSIRDFYVNIWWPDMMNFADTCGLKYTGLAIECYDDTVDGSTEIAPDKGTFLNFGNMLLRQGGEIGYHGYNHQPLCFDNCDYKGIYDYKTWENYDAMKSAFNELESFCEELFPDVKMQVYVPPSNILSKEGREFLLREYPQIKTISGIYFQDADLDFTCVQEFDVSSNGVVDQPRISYGCKLEPFSQLAAFSELNFHYVNTHFTHPDDALDPERGAELGWKQLKNHFNEYLSWLYTSSPNIRNFTGSELSAAIQRYVALTVSKEITDNKMIIKLGNFYDEAHLLVRFNEKTPEAVDGGVLTNITGNLYLLEANKDTVTISIK